MDVNINSRLEVLICTIGNEGIQRVLHSAHPTVEGVSYLVSWQQPETDSPVPHELLSRSDFKVVIEKSRGISRNRNHAIQHSSAPWILMGDDDIDYDADGLNTLLQFIDSDPTVDILTLCYNSRGLPAKNYPTTSFDLRHPPKGYYVTAFEIAMRLDAVKNRVQFNENISIGTPVLRSGEEDVFIYDAMCRKLRINFEPIFIGSHDHPTTAQRDVGKPHFIMTHGAVMSHIRPWSWLPRLIVHAWRERRIGFFFYMRHALAGVRYARRNHVFNIN